jgi:hypothetical protein
MGVCVKGENENRHPRAVEVAVGFENARSVSIRPRNELVVKRKV